MAAKYKKRADGRYLIQILIGYDINGKPKYKNIYAYTIKELEEKAAKARDELDKGIAVKDEKLTIETWANHWFELYKTDVEYNTKRMYELALTGHIIPHLGMYRLKDLKPHHVQELLNRLTADGKIRTAEIIVLTLKQILSQAVKNEYTYATLLYRAGVDIKTAQYLLGHSSIQMTMEIYTHLDNEKKIDEIGKFNTFMNNNIQSKISQTENM